jgi:hypothetical protein
MAKVNKKSLKRSRSKYTKKYKKRTKRRYSNRRYSKRRYSKRRMKGGAHYHYTTGSQEEEDAALAKAMAASLKSQEAREAREAAREAREAREEVSVSREGSQGKANGEILELVREYGPRLYDGGHITIDGAYDYIYTIYKQLLKAPGNILDNTKIALNKRLGGTGVKGEGVIDASSSEAMHYAVSKVGTFDDDPVAVVHKGRGGNYKYENVLGDGSCLFRAILLSELDDGYRGLPEIKNGEGRWAESFDLRNQSIEWNLENWDRDINISRVIPVTHQYEYDKVKVQYPDSDLDDKSAYRLIFEQQHIFGDEPEIRAACNVIGKPIIVYRSYAPDQRPKVYNPLQESLPNSTGRGGNDVVRILHIGNHYLAILPE